MEPGNYVATAQDWAIGKSGNKQTPFLKVKFRLKDSGLNVYWDAWLTQNTIEKVTNDLTKTGLYQAKTFMDLADGKGGKGLSTTQEVELSVILEEWTTKDGEIKSTPKVQWVNPIGGGAMKNTLAKAEAVTVLNGLNLDGAILAAQQKNGMPTKNGATTDFTADDIPF